MNRYNAFSPEDERIERASPERGPSYMHVGLPPSPREKGLAAESERVAHAYNLRPREVDRIKQRRRAFGSPCLDEGQELKIVDEFHGSGSDVETSGLPEGHPHNTNPYRISDAAFE